MEITTYEKVEAKRSEYYKSLNKLLNITPVSAEEFNDFSVECMTIVDNYGNTDTGSKVIKKMRNKTNEICVCLQSLANLNNSSAGG